jgi:hypothetical protein
MLLTAFLVIEPSWRGKLTSNQLKKTPYFYSKTLHKQCIKRAFSKNPLKNIDIKAFF